MLEGVSEVCGKRILTKQQRLPVIIPESIPGDNFISSAMTSWSGQSPYNPYNMSSNDEEYTISEIRAQMTSGLRDRAAQLLTAAKHHLYSPPEIPQYWGWSNPRFIDCHSNPMENRSLFWIPDITDCWQHWEKTHTKYVDHSNVVCIIFCIIIHDVRVEANFSLGRNVIGWRQSQSTGKTLCKKL